MTQGNGREVLPCRCHQGWLNFYQGGTKIELRDAELFDLLPRRRRRGGPAFREWLRGFVTRHMGSRSQPCHLVALTCSVAWVWRLAQAFEFVIHPIPLSLIHRARIVNRSCADTISPPSPVSPFPKTGTARRAARDLRRSCRF